MKELPKEMTPELLSLILAPEVCVDTSDTYSHELKHWLFQNGEAVKTWINIDTLTRLMIEFIKKHYWVAIGVGDVYDIGLYRKGCTDLTKEHPLFIEMHRTSLLEAILKATHWVAKEQGSVDA